MLLLGRHVRTSGKKDAQALKNELPVKMIPAMQWQKTK